MQLNEGMRRALVGGGSSFTGTPFIPMLMNAILFEGRPWRHGNFFIHWEQHSFSIAQLPSISLEISFKLLIKNHNDSEPSKHKVKQNPTRISYMTLPHINL